MRVDVVSIFPDYLAPLELSLPGKARARGLVDLRVHDLRRWTHDRHRTVDDAPYGGGAGMVMRPEPWGEALDELLDHHADPVLVVPTPGGTPFTQAAAAELAGERHLVVACGRYEGIDQRVVDHYASRVRVRELSVGDYVLNGGEAAALVVLEAVLRLLPGFMGNPGSLAEESHGEEGLLEYPVYTRPPSWRGLEVPPELLSGDHGRVAAWREAQARRRTAERRPDLLHPSRVPEAGGVELRPAARGDAGELLTLQRACALEEALAGDRWDLPVLREPLEVVERDLGTWTTLVARSAGRLVGSVRGRVADGEWQVDRLMVAPDVRGRGLGRALLRRVEEVAPEGLPWSTAVVGARSAASVRAYRRAGFRPDAGQPDPRELRLRRRR